MKPTYEADGVALDVTVTFEPGALISTLTGSTAECHARPLGGAESTTIAGVATVMSATVIRAFWPQWSLPQGIVGLHVRVIPPSGSGATVYTEEREILPSLKPRP